ncbi:MAG: DotU family type IV/VI secretion system protein [Candidatus Accumulibacter sp.]|jgi:type VI protein secretion system component VasF|nr:DotU family type IV/VI secretion system protein [Accumulibacter sp.]
MLRRFFPLMSTALSSAQTGPEVPLADIGLSLRALAQAEQALPPPAAERGKHAPDPAACRLAVYAWVDELMLNAPRHDAVDWAAQSLQHAFFQTTEAGTRFFEQLDALLDALLPRVEVDEGAEAEAEIPLPERLGAAARLRREASAERSELDVYALCLLLNFQGRHYGEARLCDKLRQSAREVLKGSEGLRPSAEKRPRRRAPLSPTVEWLFYALLPLAGALLFGLYCAGFLVDLPRAGF